MGDKPIQCMVKAYERSLTALTALELQHTAPMITIDESESYEPQQQQAMTVTSETKRSVIEEEITEHGSFHGQGYELIYTSAPVLAEILGVSDETARRRLNYFKDRDVLQHVIHGRPHYYKMQPEFTAIDDDTVRTKSQIVSSTKQLLDTAREE